MARPHRPDFVGGIHHVMNRGGADRTIFHTADDGTRFLGLLGDAAAKHTVKVLAYCLMSNHFHLLLSCPEGGLSDFMHSVCAVYARQHNDRLGRDGPIFRGRFHSLLVDTDEYLACAGRYIHRNPLDVQPPVALDQYRWSSYQYFVTPAPAPAWLSKSELLGPYGSPVSYRSFVEVDENRGLLEWAVDTAILEADCDNVPLATVRRTVMLSMLSTADGPKAERLTRILDFPTDVARRMAMYRMRSHLEQHPHVRAIVERAWSLAA